MDSGYLVFPQIDPVMVKVFGLSIHWYGMMYLLAFVMAHLLANRAAAKPDSGWIVSKKSLKPFVQNTLATELTLTPSESIRLLFELNHAADSVKGEVLFIGLIPQNEVNEKVPLSIKPKPDNIYRIHFYVSEAQDNEPIIHPSITSLVRSSSTALEIGSHLAQ